jgi:hypothetical protein
MADDMKRAVEMSTIKESGENDKGEAPQQWASPSKRRNSIQIARSLDKNVTRNRLTHQFNAPLLKSGLPSSGGRLQLTGLGGEPVTSGLLTAQTKTGNARRKNSLLAGDPKAISGVTAVGILRRYDANFGVKITSSNSAYMLKKISWVQLIFEIAQRRTWEAQFRAQRTQATEQSRASLVIQRRLRARKEEQLNMMAQIFKQTCGDYAMQLILYGRAVRRRMSSNRARWFFTNYCRLDCGTVFRKFRGCVIRGQRAARSYLECGKARLKLMSMMWQRVEMQLMNTKMKGEVQDNLVAMRRQSVETKESDDRKRRESTTRKRRNSNRPSSILDGSSNSGMRRVSTDRMSALHKKWGVINSQSKNLLDEAAAANRVPAAVRLAALKPILLRYKHAHIAKEWPRYVAQKEEYFAHLQQKELFSGSIDTNSRLAAALEVVDREPPKLPVMFLFSQLLGDVKFRQEIQAAVDVQANKLVFGTDISLEQAVEGSSEANVQA